MIVEIDVILDSSEADREIMLRKGGVTSLDTRGEALLMPTILAKFKALSLYNNS